MATRDIEADAHRPGIQTRPYLSMPTIEGNNDQIKSLTERVQRLEDYGFGGGGGGEGLAALEQRVTDLEGQVDNMGASITNIWEFVNGAQGLAGRIDQLETLTGNMRNSINQNSIDIAAVTTLSTDHIAEYETVLAKPEAVSEADGWWYYNDRFQWIKDCMALTGIYYPSYEGPAPGTICADNYKCGKEAVSKEDQ